MCDYLSPIYNINLLTNNLVLNISTEPYSQLAGDLENSLSNDHKYVKHISMALDEFLHNDDSDDSEGEDGSSVKFTILPILYPNLETLTLLIDEILPAPSLTADIVTQTQLWASVTNMRNDNMRKRVIDEFEAAQLAHPDWKAPLLKFRDNIAFLANPLE